MVELQLKHMLRALRVYSYDQDQSNHCSDQEDLARVYDAVRSDELPSILSQPIPDCSLLSIHHNHRKDSPSSISKPNLRLPRQSQCDLLDVRALLKMKDDPSAQARRVGVPSRSSKDDMLVVEEDFEPG